jgi:hypothetical protein
MSYCCLAQQAGVNQLLPIQLPIGILKMVVLAHASALITLSKQIAIRTKYSQLLQGNWQTATLLYDEPWHKQFMIMTGRSALQISQNNGRN